MRLQLFQIYTTEIEEFFKKKYGVNWYEHESEIDEYIAIKYIDKYLYLIAKASVLKELSLDESFILERMQLKRKLEDYKMALPEFEIKENKNRRVII